MKITATIEIPKGCDRRIHMAYDRSGFIDLGPISDQINLNDGVMPINYGYINDTLNAEEKDEIDVIIFSQKLYKTGDQIEIDVLGVIVREDGDHKIIARDETCSDNILNEISELEKKLIFDFIGYKSKIVSIDSKDNALRYILENHI